MNLGRETLRVAVVGLGKMGLVHTCILNVLPNVKLVALCEKSGMTRKFLKRVINKVKIVDDVEKLADLDLDAVYVTTPIPSHFQIAKTIYQKKFARNLFVEKTLAQNHEEAEELCDLSRQLSSVTMVGYVRRFYVTFRKAKDLLSQEAIGKVLSFKAYAYSSDFLDSKDVDAVASRGGVLRDLGCYTIDLALWYFGDQHASPAKSTSLRDKTSNDVVCFETMDLRGIEGEFSISWCMENYRMPEVGFSITGSKGIIQVNDDKVELKLSKGKSSIWYRHDLDDNVPFWLGLPEYYREDLHFVKSVLDGHNSESSFCEAARVDQIIEQVEKGS